MSLLNRGAAGMTHLLVVAVLTRVHAIATKLLCGGSHAQVSWVAPVFDPRMRPYLVQQPTAHLRAHV